MMPEGAGGPRRDDEAPLARLVRVSGAVEATASRTEKVTHLAALLAGIPPADARLAVAYLSG
ncbi:MAG: hypothetical protein ACRELC_00580, partial [Gemmatimonadota bacterium]